ncbi:hypothetical protein B566_EDAN010267 [Ephemera danica]|nr:hypothetical protein B566_EDAN010267 [Ephemera danica]
MWRGLWIGLMALLHFVAIASSVAVMSVDVGTEWIKVAIVSPGVPMEIVLNKESKRKSPVAIAFRNGERLFGEDAMNMGVRFPQNSYSYILPLLGQRANSTVVTKFKERFPYYQIEEDPDRGTVVFKHDAETTFTPEELIAMLLQQARKDAEVAVRQPVTEVVLTVPPYFGQAARRSLLSAAAMAGLKPLQLINDYLAVAINYGIFRRKDFNETAQNMIFYDMGASSTSAAVVSFSVSKGRDPDPQATVLGVGIDRTLGGLEMQLRLRDFLGKKFNEMKKTPNDVFKNPRALAKLFKESGRVKNVLSANNDHYAQVEGLLDEIDFRVQVTRDQFEELCSDLFERVAEPIHKALKAAGLTGAGTRVPKVQEVLTAALESTTLSKSINADEAAAMGAVYKAADLSAGFKVKRFITKDAVLYPIQVVFERKLDTEGKEEAPAYKTVRRTLFGLMNPFPQKKLLTFNRHSDDFSFHVNYAELDHLSPCDIEALGSLNLTKVELGGLTAALKKMSGPGVEAKGVKAHFSLDESGVLSLAGAEMSFEKIVTESEQKEEEEDDSPLSKLGSTISKLFSGDEETKPEPPPSTEAPDTSASSTPAPSNDTAPAEAPKPKITIVKESLLVSEEKLDLEDLQGDSLTKSKKKEGALNALESFILDNRMRLETSEFIEAGTEAEREALGAALSSAADWLEDEGFGAETSAFEKRLKDLRSAANPIINRVEEHRNRPEALATLETMLEKAEKFLKVAENQSAIAAAETDEKIFTEVEITALAKVIKDTREWKVKKEKEQAATPLSQDPKLGVRSIGEKMGILDREVKYLINKAKIWKPKKPKDDKASKDNSTSEEEGAGDGKPEPAENTTSTEEGKEKPAGKETETVPEQEGLKLEAEELPQAADSSQPKQPVQEEAEEEVESEDKKDGDDVPKHEEL